MQIARAGKYLGFMVGPEKGDSSWEGPTEKFLQRCQLWEAQGTGLCYHATAYSTFAVSTLSYVSQLEAPPEHTLRAEVQGLRKVIKGPGQWAQPEDLWRLKEHYGQSSSCKSIRHTALAAQLRVWRWDPACRHDDYSKNLTDLHTALRHFTNHENWLRWGDWYRRAFALRLEATKRHYTTDIGPLAELTAKRYTPRSQATQNNTSSEAPTINY